MPQTIRKSDANNITSNNDAVYIS